MNTYFKRFLSVFALTVVTFLLFFVVFLAFASQYRVTPLQTADPNTPFLSSSSSPIFLPLIRKDYPLPTIHYFHANVTLADPGDTILLEWSTSEAISVTIYHLLPTGQLGEFWNVPITGTLPYTISESARNHTDFMLFASNPAAQWTSASLSILLTCPDVWFFSPSPAICPAAPALVSAGAEQPFEHGVMLWSQAQDLIYVLYDDASYPKWSVFQDEWDEGEPIDDPSIIPPPGYYQPVRGFGLVWREQPGVWDRLGWATEPESAYETAVQYTSYARYNDTFIRAADGNVWWLEPEQSGWSKLIID